LTPENFDITSWLLEKNNPSVRYWTLLDILDKNIDDPEVFKAQNEIMESELIKRILYYQNIGGYWDEPNNIYLPKYTATTHSLQILAELGAKNHLKFRKALNMCINVKEYLDIF